MLGGQHSHQTHVLKWWELNSETSTPTFPCTAVMRCVCEALSTGQPLCVVRGTREYSPAVSPELLLLSLLLMGQRGDSGDQFQG